MKILLTMTFSFYISVFVSAQIETRKGLYKEHWYSKAMEAQDFFYLYSFSFWSDYENHFESNSYSYSGDLDSLKKIFSFNSSITSTYTNLDNIFKLPRIDLDSIIIYPKLITQYHFNSNFNSLSIYSKMSYNVHSNVPTRDADVMFIKFLYYHPNFREEAYLTIHKRHEIAIQEIDASYKTFYDLVQPVAKMHLLNYGSLDTTFSADSLILNDTIISGLFNQHELSSLTSDSILKLLTQPTEQIVKYSFDCFIPKFHIILCDQSNNYLGRISLVTEGCVGYSYRILDKRGIMHRNYHEFVHAFDELYGIVKHYE